MRLLDVRTIQFTSYVGRNIIPKYAIASHRWAEDEPTLDDVSSGRPCNKAGYQKMLGFCSTIRKQRPDIDWLWIDTCCINKESSAELDKSINWMFRWYTKAEVCYAYLADVGPYSAGIDVVYEQFKRSEWFTRGWTLQELLAPRNVVFLSKDWEIIGSKGPSMPNTLSLTLSIADITRIPPSVLFDYASSRDISDDEKWQWALGRTTTEPEDEAYCLQGIFGVHTYHAYGEGSDAATSRLREHIRSAKRLSQLKKDRFAANRVSTLSISTFGSLREKPTRHHASGRVMAVDKLDESAPHLPHVPQHSHEEHPSVITRRYSYEAIQGSSREEHHIRSPSLPAQRYPQHCAVTTNEQASPVDQPVSICMSVLEKKEEIAPPPSDTKNAKKSSVRPVVSKATRNVRPGREIPRAGRSHNPKARSSSIVAIHKKRKALLETELQSSAQSRSESPRVGLLAFERDREQQEKRKKKKASKARTPPPHLGVEL